MSALRPAHRTRGAGAALASAALFGLSAPLAKILLQDAKPLVLSGILYLGAGLGLAIVGWFVEVAESASLTGRLATSS